MSVSPIVLVWLALGGVGLATSVRFLRIKKRVTSLRGDIAARTVFTRKGGGVDADSQCDVCFGDLDEDDVYECVCGVVSHVSCSEMTGKCPYCDRDFDGDGIRKRKMLLCPRCGESLQSYVCVCGIVVPNRDGTFVCPCGEDLKTSSGLCPSCGRGYGTVSLPVGGEQTV